MIAMVWTTIACGMLELKMVLRDALNMGAAMLMLELRQTWHAASVVVARASPPASPPQRYIQKSEV